jgi:hypothetical protein
VAPYNEMFIMEDHDYFEALENATFSKATLLLARK